MDTCILDLTTKHWNLDITNTFVMKSTVNNERYSSARPNVIKNTNPRYNEHEPTL